MRVCPQCQSVFHEEGHFCPHDRTPLLPFRPDDPRCGTLLDGRFVVLARVGRGGMGTVYRAWQLSTAREVALKLLADAVKAEPVALERFLREARVTAGLRCPHTVRVFDFGLLADGTPYLAMELVEGVPLDQLLAQGALPPARAIELVRQICLALEEAHGQGLVHRDLKPSNVMVSPLADGGDFARVLDFGVAKVLDEDATALTAENAHPGTPAYMAPEQARSEPVGPPADLYAVAVMLYEMLTGERPFAGTSAVAVLVQHAHTPPPRLTERRPALPGVAALDAVLQRGLAKQPADRYADAAAFRSDLDRLRAGQAPAAPPVAAASEPAKKRMLGLNFQALGCSVQLAIAVGALALFILPTWRQSEAPSALEEAAVGAGGPRAGAPASAPPQVERAEPPEADERAKKGSRAGTEETSLIEPPRPGSAGPAGGVSAPAVGSLGAPQVAAPVTAEPPGEAPHPPKPADGEGGRPEPPPEPPGDAPHPPPPADGVGGRHEPPPQGPPPAVAPAEPAARGDLQAGDVPNPVEPPGTGAPGAIGGDAEADDEARRAQAQKRPPRPQATMASPVGALRARLQAACGPALRGPIEVQVGADGTARIQAPPDAPACAHTALAGWRPGGPARTIRVELP